MLELPVWFEVGTFVVLGLVLLFDLLYVVKRPHEPSMKEAGLWVAFYVTLALIFGAMMFAFTGPEFGGQFLAGWVTEYSLSIDNLFVFIIIMARFSVPRKYQQEVLMVGIIIALVLRGIFILLGAELVENFSWIFYIFGAFLLWTGYKQAKDDGEDEEEGAENPLIAKLRTVVPMSEKYDGNKVRTVVNGKKVFTPMLIVFVTIGLTDLGEYLVRQMMQKRMIIDPDHLSQAARDEVMALIEAEDYSGVFSSHSWSNPSTRCRSRRGDPTSSSAVRILPMLDTGRRSRPPKRIRTLIMRIASGITMAHTSQAGATPSTTKVAGPPESGATTGRPLAKRVTRSPIGLTSRAR